MDLEQSCPTFCISTSLPRFMKHCGRGSTNPFCTYLTLEEGSEVNHRSETQRAYMRQSKIKIIVLHQLNHRV